MPKVSVIVPVYNVEPYLRKCIDSIINQTLKDIEIILVDDGSTDLSGRYCEEYAVRDNRIKVIHKSNEGLSCARNDGITASTAPYIMFVDGDDWVTQDFCKIPYNTAINSNADIVIFQVYTVRNGVINKGKLKRPIGIIDAETAVKYGRSASWNKLYKRELFDTVHYPVGRVYEDIAVTHRIIFKANKIMMLDDVLYYWLYRKDSISNCHSATNKRDGFISALERAQNLKSYGCNADIYETILCSSALSYLGMSVQNDDLIFVKAEEVLNSIKGIPPGLNWKKKAMLVVWKLNKRLFHFICSVTGQKDNS